MLGLTVLLLLAAVQSVSSLSFMADTTHIDTVKVTLTHSSHTRERRSADQLPDDLHFTFDLNGGSVDLKMSHSGRDVHDILIFMTDNTGKTRVNDLPRTDDEGVYQDESAGAVLIVKRLENNDFQLAGNFYDGGEMYKIWPETHHVDKRSSSLPGTHRISSVKQYNLHHDTRALPLTDKYLRPKRSQMTDTEGNVNVHSQHHRHRRQTQTFTVEIGVFSDFSDYTYFRNAAGGDSALTLTNIRLYYVFIEQSMQVRYNTINQQDPSISVTVNFVYLDIAQTAGASQWSEGVKQGDRVPDVTTLNRFKDYVTTASNNIPVTDHYMAFTRLDMEDRGDTSIAGIAYVGALCSNFAVSLVENTGDGFTGVLAAHELGHCLDAVHDSDAGCNDRDNYVMTPILSFPSLPNPSRLWTFSSCSVSYIGDYLQGSSCAATNSFSGSFLTESRRAGQATDADQQCSRIVGVNSKFCRTSYSGGTGFDAMCQEMYCASVLGNLFQCTRHIAQEGTSCGSGKWCESGVCVANAAAPARYDNCPQGDDPDFGCDVSQCGSYSTSDLVQCCATCAPQTTQPPTTQPPTTQPPTTQPTTTQPPTTQPVATQPPTTQPPTTQPTTTQPPTTQPVGTQPPTTQPPTTQPPTTQPPTTQPPTTQPPTTQPIGTQPPTTQPPTTQPPTTQQPTTQPSTTQPPTTQPPTTQPPTTQPPTTQPIGTQPPTTQPPTTQPPTTQPPTTQPPTTQPPTTQPPTTQPTTTPPQAQTTQPPIVPPTMPIVPTTESQPPIVPPTMPIVPTTERFIVVSCSRPRPFIG